MKANEVPNLKSTKVESVREVLDDLLKKRTISGYNWYNQVLSNDRVVTFAHMHETERYHSDMCADMKNLGYSKKCIDRNTRQKHGCYRWDADFVFKDEQGIIFPNLRIRDFSGNYLNLNEYKENNLAKSGIQEKVLIGENKGWELDLEFRSKKRFLKVVNLFLKMSSNKNSEHWSGAYSVPVLIIGEKGIKYAQELPDFVKVKKVGLIENQNEISFVIHQQFEELEKMTNFEQLLKFGFKIEPCIGNKEFIDSYVNGG